ncbi:hypothetical protein BH09PSE1_BH09PSE1_23440 [soil metagenome]
MPMALGLGLGLPFTLTKGGGVVEPVVPMNDHFAALGATQPWMAGATTPPAIRVGDKYFLAEETWHPQHQKRQQSVTSYDRVSKRWVGPVGAISQTIDNDDHGTPSICSDHQGYLHIFGGPHNNNMQHSISRYPGDASHWNKQATTALAGKYTYPHPTMVGSTLNLFMRFQEDSALTRYSLYLVKSATLDAGVLTWGAPVKVGDLGADTRWYIGNSILRGTDIHMVATRSTYQDDYRRDVYYMIWDTVAGLWKNQDGSYTTALIERANAEANFRIYTHAADTTGNIPQLEFDTAGRPHVVFQTGPLAGFPGEANGKTTINDGYHMAWTGSAWTTPFMFGQPTNRYDGCTIVPEADGGVTVWWSADLQVKFPRGGDMLRRKRSAAASWSAAETFRLSETYPLANPLSIRDGDTEGRMVFAEYSGDQTIEAQLKTWVVGDGGYIKRPTTRPSIVSRFNTKPTGGDLTAIQTLETTLRDQGILDLMDLFYVFAAPTSQGALLNWAKEGYDLVVNGAPTFTPNRGFTGVASGWLDTGYSSYNLTKLLPDSVTLGMRSLTAIASNNQVLSKASGSGAEILMNPRNSALANNPTFRLHENFNGTILQIPDTTGLQHYTATKTASTRTGFINGVQAVTDTLAPFTTPITGDLSVFRAGGVYNLNQAAYVYAGGYLDDTKVAALHAAMAAYTTALGIA